MSDYDIVVIFIDGKRFEGNGIIIAPDRLLEKQRSEAERSEEIRWVGTALQEIEPKLRKVKGYRHLKELRAAMKNLNQKSKASNAA